MQPSQESMEYIQKRLQIKRIIEKEYLKKKKEISQNIAHITMDTADLLDSHYLRMWDIQRAYFNEAREAISQLSHQQLDTLCQKPKTPQQIVNACVALTRQRKKNKNPLSVFNFFAMKKQEQKS